MTALLTPPDRDPPGRPVVVRDLRDYQAETIDRALSLLRRRHLLIESPTGAGKTMMARVVAAVLMGVPRGRTRHVIFTAPQTHIEDGFTSAEDAVMRWTPESMRAPVAIPGGPDGFVRRARHEDAATGSRAILDYLATRNPRYALATTHAALSCLARSHAGDVPADLRGCLLVVDEAHHAAARSLSRAVDLWDARGARLLYLTATPSRGDGRAVIRPGMKVLRRSAAQHMEDGHAPRHFVSRLVPFGSAGDAVGEAEWTGRKMVASESARDSLVRIVVEKWVKSGRPKTIVYLPPLRGGSRPVILALIAALRKAGAGVVDATGVESGRQAEFNEILSRERGKSFADSTVDVIVGCQRVHEGTDWPACSDVYCVGIPGSLQRVSQLIGRGMRRKGDDYPESHREIVTATFFVPTAGGEALNGLSFEHSRHTLMTCVFLADFEAAAGWTLEKAVRGGLKALGVGGTDGAGGPIHGLDDETYLAVKVAMAAARQDDPAIDYEGLIGAARAAVHGVDEGGLAAVAVAMMVDDVTTGEKVRAKVAGGLMGLGAGRVRVPEEVRAMLAEVTREFRAEQLGDGAGRELDGLADQVHGMTGGGMTEWAKRMAGGVLYEYRGGFYTVSELSRETGIHKSTLYFRLKTMTAEEAVTMWSPGAKKTRSIPFLGRNYGLLELSRETGISKSTLRNRLKTMTAEEAVALESAGKLKPLNIKFNGKSYNLCELSRDTGIHQSTLGRRLKTMTAEEAVALGSPGTNKPLEIPFLGRNHTLRELSRETGIHPSVFRGRLKKMTAEEAVAMGPPRKGNTRTDRPSPAPDSPPPEPTP